MSTVRANTLSEKLFHWVIRQRYLYGTGKGWLGSLDVVIPVVGGLALGWQFALIVFLAIAIASYSWGLFLYRMRLISYEMEYTSLINPVMRRLDNHGRKRKRIY